MKYVVILGDGMADEPVAQLDNKTPLQVAHKPVIDELARKGELGLVNTIPQGMNPGSDTANLSVMGYDPKKYYTGRSPLEAVSMGIKIAEDEICFRCNVVTLTDGDVPYEERRVIDHSADEITSEEAKILIEAVQDAFGGTDKSFYPGVSYRHALILKAGEKANHYDMTLIPPHDILEKVIGPYMPKGDFSDVIHQMMKDSYDLLVNHPINVDRRNRGLRAANSIWIWGEGSSPSLPSFQEKFGKKGSVISAVDLLKGIAIAANMQSIDVVGATGNIHTNYEGKVEACLEALQSGQEFVYVHIEAPDECGHRGEVDNKVLSIEQLDSRVVKPIKEGLDAMGVDYRLMVLPDHPTPLNCRTHTSTPVPYLIYDSRQPKVGLDNGYTEESGKSTGIYQVVGHELMSRFLEVD